MPGFWLSTARKLQSRSVKCQFCRNSYRTQHLYSASLAWCDDGLWFTHTHREIEHQFTRRDIFLWYSSMIYNVTLNKTWIMCHLCSHFHLLWEKLTPTTEGDTALAAGLSGPTHHLLAMSECFGVVWPFETNQRTRWVLNKEENTDDWRANYLLLAEMFSFSWLFKDSSRTTLAFSLSLFLRLALCTHTQGKTQ